MIGSANAILLSCRIIHTTHTTHAEISYNIDVPFIRVYTRASRGRSRGEKKCDESQIGRSECTDNIIIIIIRCFPVPDGVVARLRLFVPNGHARTKHTGVYATRTHGRVTFEENVSD